MKKFTAAIFVIVLTLCIFMLCACSDKGDEPKSDGTGYVRTEGTKLLDGNGNPIGFYGTNLGGWLVQESWLVPTDIGEEYGPEYGQIDMMLTLANRFGEDGMNRLLNVYEDNWVTEADFERLTNLGFNCVRIPFTYLNLTTAITLDEESGQYVRTPYADLQINQEGFKRIDRALEMCQKYGIYAILDMHGAVGSQSGNDHTGDISNPNGGLLWNDDETGEICRQKTKEIWIEIAKRYKDNKCVAMYDLMNEPGIKTPVIGQITNSTTAQFHDELYKAIRNVDQNHIVCMEACWTAMTLPSPSEYGWTNVVYEYHHYNWASGGMANNDYYASLIEDNNQNNHGVPILIGEFNVWADSHEDKIKKWAGSRTSDQTEKEAWSGVMELYCGMGWNFTTWNFKHAAEHSSWGIFNYDKNVENIEQQANYFTMTEEEIAAIWARHNSKNYLVNNDLVDCIKPYIATFNVNGNDTRSVEELDKDYYILRQNYTFAK